MTSRLLLTSTFAILCATQGLLAQAPGSIQVRITETAGIRRNTFPVNTRVPFARGVLQDTDHLRLVLAEQEIGAQFAAESRWPDHSIQWLSLDFNATIGPLENQAYRVEHGADVKANALTRGLMVTETANDIQAGNVRFSKMGAPLVTSVRYRQEDIGAGPNGFSITDVAGSSHDLSTATELKAEVVKPGPLYVVVRYTGRMVVDSSYSAPFVITAEMPNSKSWVKYTAAVEDSAKRVRDIAFSSPLTLTAAPLLWDFGTGSWTYGSFRNPTDSVVMTQTVKANANDWQVKVGAKGQELPYEAAGGSRPKIAEGWGHFQDAKEVIAFAIGRFGRVPGTYAVGFDATGQSSYRFAPTLAGNRIELTIFQHYVASPTPIGAVTSPVSMMNSLVVSLDRDVYTKAGVPYAPLF